LEGDRPPRLLRAGPARRRAGPLPPHPRALPRGERGGIAARPPGGLATDDAAHRPPDLPPLLEPAELQGAPVAAARRARRAPARPGDAPAPPRRIEPRHRPAPRGRLRADPAGTAQDLPARRPARLRARPREEHRRDRKARGPRPLRGALRPDAR